MAIFMLSCARKLVTCLVCLALCLYVILPVLLTWHPHFIDYMVFFRHISRPFAGNLADVALYGLDPALASNHQIITPDGAVLGVWLVRPPSHVEHRNQVVIYLHGNGGHRGRGHNVAKYKILTDHGFDVVAPDYRGYADSECLVNDCSPSELALTTDCRTVYEWTLSDIAKRWKGTTQSIIVWGQSLGAGVASNLARNLCPANIKPSSSKCEALNALIVESAFSDLVEAVAHHPLMWPFAFYQPVLAAVSEALIARNLRLNNTDSLGKLRLPILMLHADDDLIVRPELSRKAFLAAASVRTDEFPPLEYKLFIGDYGHKELHRAPELLPTVINFLEKNAKK